MGREGFWERDKTSVLALQIGRRRARGKEERLETEVDKRRQEEAGGQ